MDFQFAIPITTNDLLNSSGDCYYVKSVYTLQEIPAKLSVCKDLLFTKGPEHILEEFDTYFAIINADNTNTKVQTYLLRAFDLLFLTTTKLSSKLSELLSTASEADIPDRNSYLNLTKMILYLLINVVRKIDDAVEQSNQEQSKHNLKRGRKPAGDNAFEAFPDWHNRRSKFLTQLYNMMCMSLPRLWSPPVPDEQFVSLVCMICCRTIEKSIDNGDTAFQILGIAIKRYNYAMIFPMQMLQILRNSEHAAISIANGVKLLHDDFGITSVFSVLAKEITNALSSDSGDSAVARNYSNFLMKLGTIAPKIVIPHIANLSEEWLNAESTVLRNCVLQIMGDSIIGELTGENLSEENKEIRDDFLESLYHHILDVSAHVRAKVLQIWSTLVTDHAVPLSFQNKVLAEVVDRLNDKTATVRKYAVQLVKVFLENNPYSSKLTIDELQKNLAEAIETRDKLAEEVQKEQEKLNELGLNAEVERELKEKFSIELKNMPIIPQVYEEEVVDAKKRIVDLFMEQKYKEVVVLCRKLDKSLEASMELLSREHTFDELCDYFVVFLRAILLTAHGISDTSKKLDDQNFLVTYLKDSIEFAELIKNGIQIIEQFLYSKTNSDVLEAVDLFTMGYLFGIHGTKSSLVKMLHLVWSSEKEKKEAVSNAFKRVLVENDLTGRPHAIAVVKNLIAYLNSLNYGYYLALEALIHEWVESEIIDTLIIQVLFEYYTQKLENTTEHESLLALKLLTICAQVNCGIAHANIGIIEQISLGERGKQNPALFAAGMQFLVESLDTTVNNNNHRVDKRYFAESPIVVQSMKYYEGFFMNAEVEDFENVTTPFVEFIYGLCQQPDIISLKLIKNIMLKIKEFCLRSEVPNSQQTEQPEPFYSQSLFTQTQTQTQSQPQQTPPNVVHLFSTYAARFLNLIGCLTLKELIFLDIDVYNNMKYRQELAEFEEKKQKNRKTLLNVRPSLNMSASLSLKRLSEVSGESKEPDEDLVGASAEDNVAEQINHICEIELLDSEKSILRKIFPWILDICKFPYKFNDENLQQAATLCLIRFMCVSSMFCSKYISFLINILDKTSNITIKCNIILGMSDLTFRFPNVTEPYICYMYNILHSNDKQLRLTAVKMLSHLILHEMIRVKGQIADLALCIVDDDDDIRARTLQFFREIANKSNILYNVLPDIISKLSDEQGSVIEEKYHIIMRYILSLIQKDRQVESLVEKLCMRFPKTHNERQWRDIAYCLSLLTYNERSIKKLIDNIQCFKDKVQVTEVYDAFKLIMANASKLAKPELKALITELETRINECFEVRGEDGENINRNEAAASSAVIAFPTAIKNRNRKSKPARGKPVKRGNAGRKTTHRGRRKARSSSESSSTESSD